MRKTNFYILSLLFLFSSLYFLQGCKDDTVTNPPAENVDTTGLTRLGYADAIGARANIKLYTEEPLHTGYNKLYAVLHDSLTGVLITDAHVIPSLTDHALGGPAEMGDEEADAGGRFTFAVIFLSPQAIDNPMHWNIKVGVHNHGATGEPYGTATFGGLHIADYTGKYTEVGIAGDTTLYISYIQPKTPVTGLNDFEFVVNKSKDTLHFYTDNSYNITVKPVLISSGTPSAGNINPVPSTGDYPHYKGKVNFTSAGTWRINLYMTRGSYSDSTYFETGF